MPRNAPDPPTWHDPPGHDTITLQLKLITPMFGGGYEPRHVDTVNPIRAASIRGHLRFWWRALYGGRHTTPQALFSAEEALWGSMEKPGKVRIEITDVKCGDPVVWAQFERNPRNPTRYRGLAVQRKTDWPRYALHPFQGQLEQGGCAIHHEPDRAIETGSFKIRVACRDCPVEEVIGAIRVWVQYGGVGSRTRRGCGSLESGAGAQSVDPRAAVRPGESPIPAISGTRYVLGKPTGSAIAAWKTSVDLYAAFRQMRYPGHAPMPGRSRWPEPDSIRRIEGRPSYAHQPRHAVQRGFPRADLGLPIVFHFKDYGDPAEHILQPRTAGATRLASPVITKAFAGADGAYRPMIAVLHAPHAWEFGDLDLSGTSVGRAWIDLSPADQAKCEPLSGRDVRTAVLEYARHAWSSKIEVLP